MKFFGTVTGLPAAPEATPAALPTSPEGGTDYQALALLCLAGLAVIATIAYVVGRKRRR